jgi:hypothetical protein
VQRPGLRRARPKMLLRKGGKYIHRMRQIKSVQTILRTGVLGMYRSQMQELASWEYFSFPPFVFIPVLVDPCETFGQLTPCPVAEGVSIVASQVLTRYQTPPSTT